MKNTLTQSLFSLCCLCWSCDQQVDQQSDYLLSSAVTLDFAASTPIQWQSDQPTNYQVKIEAYSQTGNANLSLLEGDRVLIDNLSIPDSGSYDLKVIVGQMAKGDHQLTFQRRGGDIRLDQIRLTPVSDIALPAYQDISESANFKTVDTWKYGGPSIADVDNDGDYDFILNNHDKVPAKLFWNNGDGTVDEHSEPLYRWDIHGSTAGDYDNDGDLDIVIAQGGGNGTDPQPPHVLRNDQGVFTEVTKEIGITEGARGRSVRWIDMDLDGDLDFLMINAQQMMGEEGPRNFVYENKGDGTFAYFSSPAIEKADAERLLITDFNNDHIDDLILFSPLSLWQGNGDLTYTDVTKAWAGESDIAHITGAAALDYDNDGDWDLYLSRGKVYYEMANQSLDYNPIKQRIDLREEGNEGRRGMTFRAAGDLVLSDFYHWYRRYDGGFPIYLGKEKIQIDTPEDSLVLSPSEAQGWPEQRNQNGWYFGYLGDNQWQCEWVKNGNIYWGIRMSISGVSDVQTTWDPQNRHVNDILLSNEGQRFTDVSNTSEIPLGGNHQGVSVGDFNNDGFVDLFLHRFGFLHGRVMDVMALNNGKGKFIQWAQHGATDPTDEGHGDMGQAFDFDLDGQLDMLNGSDADGHWYLYKNEVPGHYALIHLGYSPESNVDPYSAIITIETASGKQYKRVGSEGAIHSQSLLNIVHFGLAKDEQIEKLTIRWRNGEEREWFDLKINQLIKVGQ
ncbi:FG-GAP-like repeat-containing protein [Reichenbachiella sp.]|uniref:FG-GAP-like repeat-containing protein n=1 Tax=Reichenbachiella sp. TaxID=2184521 RepID=UPI003BB090AD